MGVCPAMPERAGKIFIAMSAAGDGGGMEKRMRHTGKVWIAGAGPGDAELLTVKVEKLLKDADVIVYDALVSAEILSRIPADKECIFVGKRLGNHAVPQWKINQLLVEEAQKGKKVLRLKGGDPFVFGRGGEEAEALVENGVPFEVVPGITSAVAVPAYAGIPVTHRDYVSSFHVVTGHPRKDGESRISYETLAKIGGTLIFLMGLSSLEEICVGLVNAGMDAGTPTAVIAGGTSSRQRTVISTLSEIAGKVEQADLPMPALIVVGEVCALAEQFEWASKRPLDGRQIVVTRPRENPGDLAMRLRAFGAQVIEMPTIRIRPVRDICPEPPGNPALRAESDRLCPEPSGNQALREELGRLCARLADLPEENGIAGGEDGPEWLVFTSPIGVKTFFEQLKAWRFDVRKILGAPGRVRIAAIGAATADRLGEYGIFDVEVPEKYCARALGEYIAETTMRLCGDRVSDKHTGHVTVLRARAGSRELLPPLEKANLVVSDIALYDTVYAEENIVSVQVRSLLEKGEIDAVTFTSGSTVRGFAELTRGEGREALYQKFQAVCIGAETEAVAKEYGMRTVVAAEASMDALVQAILENV